MTKKWLPVAMIAVSAFACLAQTARAQRRGEVVEGLLRGFLEVQLERERQKALERQELADRHRHHPEPYLPLVHCL